MADELIDILDKNGEFTGEVRLKSEAHQLGLYHASVHIWLYTNDKKVLLQKRAKNKDTYPSLWDVSVAGHISANESKEDSAIREIEEEIGLSLNKKDLDFIGSYLSEKQPTIKIIDKEYHYIYLVKLTQPIEKLTLQKEEVDDVKLIPIEQIKNDLKNLETTKQYVPHDIEYYNFILKEITNRFE
ncbi:Isopentenyldiphosphate isomerase [Aquimarina amphilecti]|uniref:Isopentenyldiphosphate isomerase n=1 Tax=Aquimarina amphilecti TaxID=1038014 RepID=A0A1H7WUT1_AQUAM|nr:NUDIX domain-containing protein [Aquimarina amphilecti]SEM25282.1 Isopentenyldiphosphate isomerase [Aquimarina amphilecti]